MKLRRKIGLAAGIVVGVFGGVFVGANGWDYLKFKRAIDRIESLSPKDWEGIADYAKGVERPRRFAKGTAPTPLSVLKPLGGSFSKGFVEVSIYEMGDAYLSIRVSTSPRNQEIIYFTNSMGPQRTQVLWNRNPEFVRSVSPIDRLVTVTQWSSSGQSWIVTRDAIVVIRQRKYEGEDDVVVGRAPLDAAGLARITRSIEGISAGSRGKHHNADDVHDGFSLEVRFSPNGEKSPDDITLSNAWSDEVRPLLDAVSTLGPKEFPINFERLSRFNSGLPPQKVTVRSQEEWDNLYQPIPRTGWWNVWRKLVR